MRTTLSVTQEDIEAAKEWVQTTFGKQRLADRPYEAYCEHCPISYALLRTYGGKRAEVGHSFLLVEGGERTLRTDTTPELLAWMSEFDHRYEAAPTSFEIEWEG